MRVFVYEHLSASLIEGPETASLRAEGWAMLSSVLSDLGGCPTVQTMALVAPPGCGKSSGRGARSESGPAKPQAEEGLAMRWNRGQAHPTDLSSACGLAGPDSDRPSSRIFGPAPPPSLARVKDLGLPITAHLAPPGEEEAAFRALARDADFTLVIAPESDDLLLQRVMWAESEGARLLGPSAEAVRLTGDKLTLAQHLQQHDVPTPPVVQAARLSEEKNRRAACTTFPLVCKPRHGAGSQATFLLRGPAQLASCPAQALAEGCRDELIVQPYVPGLATSVAFLAGPGQLIALPPTQQLLSHDGRFRYQGGRLPLPPDLAERAVRLAERAVRAVRGLSGYFGVDLVLGPTADDDVVIEINPRLTTSYVGLRALACINLAEALLAVVLGRAPLLDWRPGPVRFWADGRLETFNLAFPESDS